MSLRKEDSSEMTQGFKFVRNSKLRQSVRIKNRLQLPPSALIYIKNLEKNVVSDPVHSEMNKLKKSSRSHSMDNNSVCEELISDDSPLIQQQKI